jgi:hypothetical protein
MTDLAEFRGDLGHRSDTISHAYTEGIDYIFVNGVQVLDQRNHTGTLRGRSVRSPGWKVK